VGLIWLASIVAAGAWAHAQVIVQRPDIEKLPGGAPPPLFAPGQPLLISGGNIGFRVTDMSGDKLIGTWVVRTSGTGPWLETASSR
jgi:hypothetical protein